MEKIRKITAKNTEKPIQTVRFILQGLFVLLCIWIGVEFYFFVNFLNSGGSGEFHSRPPGVDGFLPISSLMSFYLFLRTGQVHPVHPAGFFIFTAVVLMSFIIGKSFCSWLCPVGFISEMLGDFSKKILRRNIRMPKFLDYPLRSIKYLALGFLFYVVFAAMTVTAIQLFLDAPYNTAADIKMWNFFANLSGTSSIVLISLVFLSLIFRGFWCRYLCPYGALLGIISLFSPVKIKRNTETCIDCNLCAKACPSFIKVDELKVVNSDECTSCMSCIDVCPVKDTLNLKPVFLGKRIINKKFVIFAVVGIFILVTGIGVITGMWQNRISREEYLKIYPHIEDLQH